MYMYEGVGRVRITFISIIWRREQTKQKTRQRISPLRSTLFDKFKREVNYQFLIKIIFGNRISIR